MFDGDGDLTLFAHPDRELTRRIVSAYSDQGLINSDNALGSSLLVWYREPPCQIGRRCLLRVASGQYAPQHRAGHEFADRA